MNPAEPATGLRARTNVAARATCTVIAAAAGYCAVDGLQHLPTLQAQVTARIARSSLQPVAEPSLVFFAACVIALSGVALLLAWFTRPGVAALRLCLFVALVGLGYGVILNGDALHLPLLAVADWTIRHLAQPWRLFATRVVLLIDSLLLFPAWTLAGAVLLRFLAGFPEQSELPGPRLPDALAPGERTSILSALLLASGMYAAALPRQTPVGWAWSMTLASAVAAIWLVTRHLRIRSPRQPGGKNVHAVDSSWRAVSVAFLVLLGMPLLWFDAVAVAQPQAPGAHFAVAGLAAVCLVPTLRRALSVLPWCAYVPAAVLAGTYLVLRQLSPSLPGLETDGETFVYPWLSACFLLALGVTLSRLRQWGARRGQQTLILLAGIALAGLLGLAWGIASMRYLYACAPGVSSVFCALAQHKDWLHELPGLVLAVFFALALRFPGAIDAEKLFRRTTVYGALGWLLVFGFAVLDHVIGEVFGGLLSDEMPRTIAAGALGVAVHPVKKRLEDGIDLLLKKVLGFG